MLQELEKIFIEKLQTKTGWGRNEIIDIFKSSLVEVAENNPQTSQNMSNVLTKREQLVAALLTGCYANSTNAYKLTNENKKQLLQEVISTADDVLNLLNNAK